MRHWIDLRPGRPDRDARLDRRRRDRLAERRPHDRPDPPDVPLRVPGPITSLRQRLMVVPPDFHDDQRLLTHKLRVSGCERGHRALVRHLRERRARPDVGARRARGRVHELDRRRARGGRGRRALLRAAPAGRALLGALAADPSGRRAHGGCGRAPGDRRDRARAGGAHQHSASTTISATTGKPPRSRPLPPRRGPAAPASARTTPTACSRSRGSAASRPATSRGTCSARAAPTPGSRSSSRTRTQPRAASRPFPFDPTHVRRAGLRYVTVAVGRDYADVAPTSGTYDGEYEGLLTTSKRAAVTSVEYLRPRRRRIGPAPDLLAAEQRLQPGQVPLAEGGQAVVLDLVDEDRACRARSASRRTRRDSGPRIRSWAVRSPSAASSVGHLGRNRTAHEDELERAVQIDDERRVEALDQRGQRPGLRLRAGMRARRRAVRPVREHPELGIDPRRKGERRRPAPRSTPGSCD